MDGSSNGQHRIINIEQNGIEERTPKRRRMVVPKTPAGYVKGSIVGIVLHNFKTYEHVEFQPGPHLNLIIAPNGAGKSSIVEGICLGLGGSPDIINAADSIKDFVKRDSEEGEAYMELQLAGPAVGSQCFVVRRIIHRDRNTSDWHLNCKPATKQAVMQLMAELSIQVDNPVQFLPQFKVEQFTKASPQRLLKETMRALGPQERLEQHKQLIVMSKEINEFHDQMELTKKRIEQIEKDNKIVERDVMRFNQRKKFLKRVQEVELVIPWAIYELHHKRYTEAKQKFNETKLRLDELRNEHMPRAKEVERAKRQTNVAHSNQTRLEGERAEAEKEVTKAKKAVERFDRDIAAIDVLAQTAQEECKAARKQRVSQERRIAALESDVENTIADGSVDTAVARLEEDIVQLSLKRRELTEKMRSDDNKAQDMQRQVNALGRAIQQRHVRIGELKGKSRDSSDAFYQQFSQFNQAKNVLRALEEIEKMKQREQIKGDVIGPVGLNIRVTHLPYAARIEQAIPPHIACGFVCTDDSDARFLRPKLGNLVTIVHPAEVQTRSQYKRICNLEPFKAQFGLLGWMDEFVEAPPYVMQTLVNTAGMSSNALGDDRSEKSREEVMKTGLTKLYTPDSVVSKSTYKGYSLSSVQSTRQQPAYLHIQHEVQGEIEQLQKKIADDEAKQMEMNEHHTAIRNGIADMETQATEMVEQRKNLRMQKNHVQGLISRLEVARKDLGPLQMKESKLLKAFEEQKAKGAVKRATLCRKQGKLFEVLQACATREIRLLVKLNVAQLEHVKAMQTFREKTREFGETESQFKELSKELSAVHAETKQLKADTKVALERARQVIDLGSEEHDALVDKYSRPVPVNPDQPQREFFSPDELEAKKAEFQRMANSNYADPGVIEKYDRDCQKLKQEREKAEEQQEKFNDKVRTMRSLKGVWLSALKAQIQTISQTFSTYMAGIDCAGEVSLDERRFDRVDAQSTLPRDDYENFGILINVSFRSREMLHSLNSNHQSGGEQSVSTFMYVLALQKLTPSPFRLVDEINQGVDAKKERLMHDALKACQGQGAPQYFYLSPKLQDDLNLSTEYTTVLCVYNGPFQGIKIEPVE